MAKLTGFKKVAVINLGCINYHFAIYDDGTDYQVGDKVVVSGTASRDWNNTIIKEIISAEEAAERTTKAITAEVICKINTSAYETRIEKRKTAEKIKKELNKRMKQMDELSKYEYYAKNDSEFAELFNQFKELNNC